MRRIIKFIALLVVVILCTGGAWAAEQTGSITVHLENGKGNLCLYQAENCGNGEDAEEMTTLVRNNDTPGIIMPINGNNPTVFADLPPGVYLVTHQQDVFRPFFVSVPITINGTSTYHVEAWPKTQDSQTPQTGDTTWWHLLFAAFLASFLGLMLLIQRVIKARKSFCHGKMCMIRVRNRQKRLR